MTTDQQKTLEPFSHGHPLSDRLFIMSDRCSPSGIVDHQRMLLGRPISDSSDTSVNGDNSELTTQQLEGGRLLQFQAVTEDPDSTRFDDRFDFLTAPMRDTATCPDYDLGTDSPEHNPLTGDQDDEDTTTLDIGRPKFIGESPGDSRRSLWEVEKTDKVIKDHDFFGEHTEDDEMISELEHKPVSVLHPFLSRKTIELTSNGDGRQQRHDDDDNNELSDISDQPTVVQGGYDPDEFADLTIDTELQELFRFIGAYHPQPVVIEPVLKPFILDYIPAVGDIDAFVKIPRPDEVDDHLGLLVLDEPAAKQSDPTILDLHLRVVAKEMAPKDTAVKRLGKSDANNKEIEQWIANIDELHRSKPATNVHYSKPMPDIEQLMQEWPSRVESALNDGLSLPSAEMDVTLEQYVDIVLGFLDIPVYRSRVQSLHVLFTLYSEFKNSQHFNTLANNNNNNNDGDDYDNSKDQAGDQPDTLVL